MASSQTFQPEIVVFKDPSKRKPEFSKKSFKKKEKSEKQNKNAGKHKDDNKTNFNFSEAKFEVQKLSLNAYKGGEKRQAMISYLVGLGAQPPKRKRCENYKLLTARKKAEKQEQAKNKQNENKEEQLKKLITKADHSIKQYNKILKKKKKFSKQKKQKH